MTRPEVPQRVLDALPRTTHGLQRFADLVLPGERCIVVMQAGELPQARGEGLCVIPWRGTGWALVTLSDHSRDAEWVAFVPIADVVAALQGDQQ